MKRKKKSRMRGSGTHGGGARKKRKKSGHHGGSGMSGSGKRADHKKTLITKLYGHGYFGKKGITSRSTRKKKTKDLNLRDIKKQGKDLKINLKGYKILGEGNINDKLVITADSASKSAMKKVKEAGGEIILLSKRKKESKTQDAK